MKAGGRCCSPHGAMPTQECAVLAKACMPLCMKLIVSPALCRNRPCCCAVAPDAVCTLPAWPTAACWPAACCTPCMQPSCCCCILPHTYISGLSGHALVHQVARLQPEAQRGWHCMSGWGLHASKPANVYTPSISRSRPACMRACHGCASTYMRLRMRCQHSTSACMHACVQGNSITSPSPWPSSCARPCPLCDT
jgi:hypothetical protein